jgi:hypothetical protein
MTARPTPFRLLVLTAGLVLPGLLTGAGACRAQGGPPFLTNDPGTPGNSNWEITLAAMPRLAREVSAWQIPQVDLNFGVGDRIQLTWEAPYTLQSNRGQALHGDWGNGFPGVKWRFLDQGEDGWLLSVFPQLETPGSAAARQAGIAGPGPRYLLPIEVAKRIGAIELDAEAGYYLPGHGARERILGLVAGRELNERLELDIEIYDDRASRGPPKATTVDVGGRYKVARGLIALFLAGRGVNGFTAGQPEFMGYLGIQILLSRYGATMSEPEPSERRASERPEEDDQERWRAPGSEQDEAHERDGEIAPVPD